MESATPITFAALRGEIHKREDLSSDTIVSHFSHQHPLQLDFAGRPLPSPPQMQGNFRSDSQHDGRYITVPHPRFIGQYITVPHLMPVRQEQHIEGWTQLQHAPYQPLGEDYQPTASFHHELLPDHLTSYEPLSMPRTCSMSSNDLDSPQRSPPQTTANCWPIPAQQQFSVERSFTQRFEYQNEYPTPTDSSINSDEDSPVSTAKHNAIFIPRRPRNASQTRPKQHSGKQTLNHQSSLSEHERLHHTRLERPICSDCGKDYGRQADLSRHKRSKHRNDEFYCRYCNKSFNRSDIVRRHEMSGCKLGRCLSVTGARRLVTRQRAC